MENNNKNTEMSQSCKNAVISRFLVIKEYPKMTCKLNDIIELPSKDWIYADGTFCKDDFFECWTDIFQRVNGL